MSTSSFFLSHQQVLPPVSLACAAPMCHQQVLPPMYHWLVLPRCLGEDLVLMSQPMLPPMSHHHVLLCYVSPACAAPWQPFMWWLMPARCLKRLPHCWQVYGISPVWSRICTLRWSDRLNCLKHVWHRYGRTGSLSILCLCWLTAPVWACVVVICCALPVLSQASHSETTQQHLVRCTHSKVDRHCTIYSIIKLLSHSVTKIGNTFTATKISNTFTATKYQ